VIGSHRTGRHVSVTREPGVVVQAVDGRSINRIGVTSTMLYSKTSSWTLWKINKQKAAWSCLLGCYS